MYARNDDTRDDLRDLADADLIRRYKLGSDEALSVLLERHSEALYRFSYQMTGNREDAEDVVQETIARVLTRVDTLHSGSAFRTWLFRIARNLSIDTFRKRRKIVSLPEEEEITSPALQEDGPQERIEVGEERRTVTEALGHLADSHQKVLMLREVEGLSYAEISQRLNVSQSAVETLLFRARRRLREEYSKVSALPGVVALTSLRALVERFAAPLVGGPTAAKVVITAVIVSSTVVTAHRVVPALPLPLMTGHHLVPPAHTHALATHHAAPVSVSTSLTHHRTIVAAVTTHPTRFAARVVHSASVATHHSGHRVHRHHAFRHQHRHRHRHHRHSPHRALVRHTLRSRSNRPATAPRSIAPTSVVASSVAPAPVSNGAGSPPVYTTSPGPHAPAAHTGGAPTASSGSSQQAAGSSSPSASTGPPLARATSPTEGGSTTPPPSSSAGQSPASAIPPPGSVSSKGTGDTTSAPISVSPPTGDTNGNSRGAGTGGGPGAPAPASAPAGGNGAGTEGGTSLSAPTAPATALSRGQTVGQGGAKP